MQHKMVKKLTKLRIDEISSVDRGAGEGCRVMLYKRDDTLPEQPQGAALLFNDVMLRKADVSDPLRGPRDEDDNKKLSEKLDELVTEMIVARPSLHPHRARRWLLHTPQGQQLLSTFKRKEEPPMPEVNIFKLSNIESVREIAKHITEKDDITEFDFTKILMGHAMLTKRDGESDGAAFERILTAQGNGELRQAYQVTKGMASLEPTSVGVGSSETSDDSAEAVRLLAEMAEKQGRKFEDVFADPDNKALAGRTYTGAHRPTTSTPSYRSEER
jgi:hypothetical protein